MYGCTKTERESLKEVGSKNRIAISLPASASNDGQIGQSRVFQLRRRPSSSGLLGASASRR